MFLKVNLHFHNFEKKILEFGDHRDHANKDLGLNMYVRNVIFREHLKAFRFFEKKNLFSFFRFFYWTLKSGYFLAIYKMV